MLNKAICIKCKKRRLIFSIVSFEWDWNEDGEVSCPLVLAEGKLHWLDDPPRACKYRLEHLLSTGASNARCNRMRKVPEEDIW